MDALENLTIIGLWIDIKHNQSLTSLHGIRNVNAETITGYLKLVYNPMLDYCHVASICDYLANPPSWVNIWWNLEGCNTDQQILSQCIIGTEDFYEPEKLNLYPNPAHSSLFFTNPGAKAWQIRIFNSTGQEMGIRLTSIDCLDISSLTQGLYYIEFNSGEERICRTFYVQ